MRKRIYEIVERADTNDRPSQIYDVFMIIVIFLSLVPLAFKRDTPFLTVVDKTAVMIFSVDYILRWITADYRLNCFSPIAFIRYPFTFMAIIDLLSILPSLTVVNDAFKVLRVVRMLRAMRVLRIFKGLRYSKNLLIISEVMRKSKKSLASVAFLAFGYILISALVIYTIEPDSFNTFFDAVYWATVSLTTVGYGDIYPVTVIGRIVAMISSLFGIAIVALPAGIITAGYMTEIQKKDIWEDSDDI